MKKKRNCEWKWVFPNQVNSGKDTHTRSHTHIFGRWHHKNIVLCKCIWIEFAAAAAAVVVVIIIVLRQSYNDDFTITARMNEWVKERNGGSIGGWWEGGPEIQRAMPLQQIFSIFLWLFSSSASASFASHLPLFYCEWVFEIGFKCMAFPTFCQGWFSFVVGTFWAKIKIHNQIWCLSTLVTKRPHTRTAKAN